LRAGIESSGAPSAAAASSARAVSSCSTSSSRESWPSRSRRFRLRSSAAGAPGVGEELGAAVLLRGGERLEAALLLLEGGDRVVGGGLGGGGALGQLRLQVEDEVVEGEPMLAARLALESIALAKSTREPLVVALDGRERLVGDTGGEELGGGAEERVSAADVAVEEGEGPAGVEGLQPQRHLAQLDRHRVHVHPVEAAGDDVAQGGAKRLGRGLLLAGPDGGEALGDAVGGGDEEVAGAAGGIADGEVEERPLGIGAGGGLVEQGVEGGVEQAEDEACGGVVAPRRLPLVAGGGLELEDGGVGVQRGVELEQGLVDRAQLLGAQVAVVHRPAQAPLVEEGEGAHGVEEVAVRKLGAVEAGRRLGGEEEAAQGGQGKLRAAGLAAEQREDEAQGPVGRDPRASFPACARRGGEAWP